MGKFETIVLRAQQGDKEAISKVVRKLYYLARWYVNMNWVYVSGGTEREDMVQMAVIKAWESLPRYVHREKGRTANNWFILMMKRACNTEAKRIMRDKRSGDREALYLFNPLRTDMDDEGKELLEFIPSAIDIERDVIISVTDEEIRKRLASTELTVYRLSMLDYTTADIVWLTGLSAKTVDNAKTRIKRKGQKIWREE